MPCMVPTRTASFLDLADSDTVGMPAALSAAAASFPIQCERAVPRLGIGYGLMPYGPTRIGSLGLCQVHLAQPSIS
jgi:hypothetical protein